MAALALLSLTYSIPDSMVPRVIAICIGVVGVATAFGFIPVRAPQDYYGGLVLLMLATLALIASSDLPGQRGFAFGPGTAPRLFAGVLGAFAIAVTVVGVTADGPRIEKYQLRGPVMVLIGICLFAATIRPFGLLLSSFTVFMVSVAGSEKPRWIEGAIAAVAMTILCVLLFVYLLNLPFQLWPQPNALEVLWTDTVGFFMLIFGPLLKFLGVM
jgi:putative tricarboxylic transport membrane protein